MKTSGARQGDQPGEHPDLARVATDIRQSERRYRSLVENATALFVICDAEGTVRYISPSLHRLLGHNPPDEVGRANVDNHHPDDLPRVIEAFERAVVDGRVEVEFRIRHADGTWRWLDMVVINRLDDPDVEGFVLNGHDITERKHAEELVQVREEWWRALLRNSKDAIAVLGADGRVAYVSRSIEGVVGYDQTTMFTMSVFELVHPDDLERATDIFRALSEGQQISDPIEMRVFHADGEYRWIEAIANNQLDNPVVKGVVVNVRDVTERKHAEEKLARQALYDSLTGLANRSLFLARLTSALTRARQSAAVTAVIFLDLDHFRLINDSMGHVCGDLLLVEVANRLRALLREGDTAARIGGDEFALCCEDIGGEGEASQIAQRVADVLRTPVELDGQELTVTASVGITCATDEQRNPEDVLRDADVAMYRAKERGGARAEAFDGSMRTRVRQRLEHRLELRRALAGGQFRLTFQPIVNLADGQVTGAEALLRWAHPRRGIVLPGEFIPATEETGLIEPLGTWVLAQSIAEAAGWNHGRAEPLGVSVNLSPRQLASGHLPEVIATALAMNDLAPHLLCLEITETVLMNEEADVVRTLRDLSALGVRLAIDDFGTGYSSLAYLKRFSVDILKVDRAFIHGIDVAAENRAIVNAVLGLASSLGLTIIAEGVETRGQVETLTELGCAVGQGFYFSTPVTPEVFKELVAPSRTR